MTATVLLDTHVLYWWSLDPELLSARAREAVEQAGSLAVCPITWFELATAVRKERIGLTIPVEVWLERLSSQVHTLGTTPRIALAAASLAVPFPGDPADRLIYATAVEHGIPLVTKDQRIRKYAPARKVALW